MAKSRKEQKQDSGDKMEVSSPEISASVSESGSGSGSDTESEQPPKKSVATPKKLHEPSSSSSESESVSDRVTQKPNPVTKPISSKPLHGSHKSASTSEKPKSNTKLITSPKKLHSGAGDKRPANDGEAKESKRSKRKRVEEEIEKKPPTEDVKKKLFQRIWTEDDEIAILKGMIEYRSKKKSDPVADLNAFHEFIKKSLSVDVVDVSNSQLQDKIRRLKKKYFNNAKKEVEGKGRTFSKSHEQKSYNLSKKIWGNEKIENGSEVELDEVDGIEDGNVGKARSKSVVKHKDKKDDGSDGVKQEGKSVNVVEGSFISRGINMAAMEEWLEKNSGLLSAEKRDLMKEKWASLEFAEMELYSKRIALMQEQFNLVQEALRTSRK